MGDRLRGGLFARGVQTLFPLARQRSVESCEQQAFFAWIRRWERCYPELYLVHHVANGGWRHPTTAKRLWAEGVRAGIPDVAVPIARAGWHGLFLEFKSARGRLTTEQQRVIEMLRANNYRVEVVRSACEAASVLADYLGVADLRMP